MKTTTYRTRFSVVTALGAGLVAVAAGCSSASPMEATERTSQALSPCGLEPKGPVCNDIVKCTGDGWTFYPSPKGTPCKTRSGAAGTCDGGINGVDDTGECVANPVTNTGTMHPAYFVVDLAYAPPGNGSQVTYGSGGSFGTEVDIQNLFKAGVQVQVSGHVLGQGATAQFGFAEGPVTGSSWESTTSTSSTLQVTSVVDPLSHDNDVYILWTNPELAMSQTGSGPVDVTLLTNQNAGASIVPVTLGELKNPSLLAKTWKAPYFANFKATDYASLVGLDDLAPNSPIGLLPQPYAPRYTEVQELQLDGPDNSGDPIVGFGATLNYEQTSGSVDGFNTATTASFFVDTGFNLFGVFATNVQAGGTFEWDYQKLTNNKIGVSESAAVNLQTPTVQYHQVVYAWFDHITNSFAFTYTLPIVTASAAIEGVVVDASGKPVAGRAVDVVFANGKHRTVGTNAHGIYRVFNAPAGEATVVAGQRVARVVVAEAGKARLDIEGVAR
jgi:hypothetical protein